jgi:hypothetical protein
MKSWGTPRRNRWRALPRLSRTNIGRHTGDGSMRAAPHDGEEFAGAGEARVLQPWRTCCPSTHGCMIRIVPWSVWSKPPSNLPRKRGNLRRSHATVVLMKPEIKYHASQEGNGGLPQVARPPVYRESGRELTGNAATLLVLALRLKNETRKPHTPKLPRRQLFHFTECFMHSRPVIAP